MSQLIRKAESGSPETYLDEDELRAVAGLVLAAGFETTVNLLGNGIRMLLDNPGHLQTLSRRPELWPNAVEEILRLESPVQLTARLALKDTEVAGKPVGQGELVVVYVAAANRDPAVFPTRIGSTSNGRTPAGTWLSPADGTSAWGRPWPVPKVKWGCGPSSTASPRCAPRARAVGATPAFCMAGRRCLSRWARRGRWPRASRSSCRRSSTRASWCRPAGRCG